jgi:hypothetical protein
MRKILIWTALGLVFATALAPTPARAATTIHFAQDDLVARAIFRSADDSGCVLTEVSAVAVDGRRKDGQGPGAERSEANLTISRYDACTDTLLTAAEGSATLGPEAFLIDRLESAALHTSIEVFDAVSNSSFPVDVALTWEGVGDPIRQRIHTHLWTQAFSLNFRFDGTDRPAAAAGTVTDGTTNFTPEPGVNNTLLAIRAGRLEVQRN